MLSLMCACLLVGSSLTASREYGPGGGTVFSYSSQQLNGPITALRVRENPSYILGLQFCYGNIWGPYYGNADGTLHEVVLRPEENITQVSGKVNSYIAELIFMTSHGRLIRFGQPSGTSFNDYPEQPGNILRYVSGRYSPSYIHSIGFHWGLCVNCNNQS
ncbi:zymogen granule membrane protein 16-like [Discoglossus pictus]